MGATYTLWFAFHFWNFVFSHGDLKQEEEFMSPVFQKILVNSSTYDPHAQNTDGFWKTFTTFNIRMVVHSNAITQPHAWGTRPWEWIWNSRGVSYWGSTMGGGPDDKASIYLMGNPLESWGVIAALGLVAVIGFLHLRTAWYAPNTNTLVDFFRSGKPFTPITTQLGLFAITALQAAAWVRFLNDPSSAATSMGFTMLLSITGFACVGIPITASPARHSSSGGASTLEVPSLPKKFATLALLALSSLAALGLLGAQILGLVGGVENHHRLIFAGPCTLSLLAAALNGWGGWAATGFEKGVVEVFFQHTPTPPGAVAPKLHLNALVIPVFWCILGWLVNLLPYAAIHRTTFAYHYMPALVYGNLLLALITDRLAGVGGSLAMALATGACWLFYRPWIFGYGLTEEEHARRRWLERWN